MMMIVMIVSGISTQEVAVNTLTMFKMGLEGRGFRDMMIPYMITRSLGWGPSSRLWALRAFLITSFTPFRRSGRVTHATVQ